MQIMATFFIDNVNISKDKAGKGWSEHFRATLTLKQTLSEANCKQLFRSQELFDALAERVFDDDDEPTGNEFKTLPLSNQIMGGTASMVSEFGGNKESFDEVELKDISLQAKASRTFEVQMKMQVSELPLDRLAGLYRFLKSSAAVVIQSAQQELELERKKDAADGKEKSKAREEGDAELSLH